MRTLRPVLLALTAVAALSFACPAKANLITNPGFENGHDGWGDQFSVITFPAAAHSGKNFAAFVFNNDVAVQSVAATTGATYTISFFASSVDVGQNGSGTLNATWGGTTVFSHLFSGTSGYAEYTFNVTAVSPSTSLAFFSSGMQSFFNIRLDDISMELANGVPDGGTTVSLLGCALVGLAGLRRKLGC